MGRVPFRVVLRPRLVDPFYLEHVSSGRHQTGDGWLLISGAALLGFPASSEEPPSCTGRLSTRTALVLPSFRRLNQLLVEIL